MQSDWGSRFDDCMNFSLKSQVAKLPLCSSMISRVRFESAHPNGIW